MWSMQQATGGIWPSSGQLRLVSAATCGGPLWLARQEKGDASQHQHDADHRKGIGKSQHQRLQLDGLAQRNDGLMARARRIGHAMRHEVIRHRRNPLAHFLTAEIYGLSDDVGVELL